MNENDLMNALDDRADAITVGPAPIDSMTRSAARTRRRNALAMGTAGLAVLAVAGVGVAVGLSGDDRTTSDRAPDVAAADVPPAGYLYVGVGGAAIAVPEDWPRNDTECSQVARGDTYVIDQGGAACLMLVPYPADTTSVTITPGGAVDTSGWTPVEVDGADALRSPTEQGDPGADLGGVPFTTASIYVPEHDALFAATSSVSGEAIDDLLAGIVVLDEHVAVPGFSDLGLDGSRADDAYIERLQALGLEVELLPQVDKMKRPPGEVIVVEPQPGTVVDPGSVVRVTAAR